ncbi:MAG TPA: PAS domain-containing protein, partial [Nocardioidaceae bacterium]|nr:PAS domain-containing protein [Nocardioidaceae bacterium]
MGTGIGMGTGEFTSGQDAEIDVLDALPDGVVVADENGRVTVLNDAAQRLLGVADGVGKHLSDVLALQDRAGNTWFNCANPYSGLPTRTRLT